MLFFFSFMWGMSLYYIENWNWSIVMAEKLMISTSFCPEGGSPLSLWLVYIYLRLRSLKEWARAVSFFFWNNRAVSGHGSVSPPAAKTTQCLLTLGWFLASERLLSGVGTLFPSRAWSHNDFLSSCAWFICLQMLTDLTCQHVAKEWLRGSEHVISAV
jgi:hypothetical protein